jgi:pimeloyl-ACP methyl ester carboxylesterase
MVKLAEHALRSRLRRRGFSTRWVQTDSGRVHVLEHEGTGDLPPLVLMHGLSAAGVHFRPILQALCERHCKLILPDLPGHGFSEIPLEGMSPEVIYQSMLQVLDTVVHEPAIFFGNSLGGVGSVRYAGVRPERVAGLILLSPGGALMGHHELRSFLEVFDMRSHRDALDFVDRLFDKPPHYRHMLAWGARRTFSTPAVRQLIGSITSEDLLKPQDLAELSMPTLVLWGGADGVLPQHQLDYWRTHLPAHASFLVEEGFGHCAFLDRPGLVVEHMLRFAEAVVAPAPSLSTA